MRSILQLCPLTGFFTAYNGGSGNNGGAGAGGNPTLTPSANLLSADLTLASYDMNNAGLKVNAMTGNNDAKKLEIVCEPVTGDNVMKISTWVEPNWAEAPVSGTPSITRNPDGGYSITEAVTFVLELDATGSSKCRYGDVAIYGDGVKISSIKYYY